MSEATRRAALDKLAALQERIGHPDKWRDVSALRISRTDAFGNLQRVRAAENARDVSQIGLRADPAAWPITPQTANSGYSASQNMILFPAGILQPPIYDAARDGAVNYGAAASLIGHELTHGFDDTGRRFDAKGNVRDWWTPADAKAFEERTACIVDEYSQFVVAGDTPINGKLTLGENIADLGGLILAYAAWKVQTAGQQLEDRDGLTPEQRFFVGYAQWACENDRPENQRVKAITDPHSPGKYRVNGLLANMPEFAKAFACKPQQPMVSEKPCRVW